MSYEIFREFGEEHLDVVCSAFESGKGLGAYCPIGLLLSWFGTAAGHRPSAWEAAKVLAGLYPASTEEFVNRLARQMFEFTRDWDTGIVVAPTLRQAMGLPAR